MMCHTGLLGRLSGLLPEQLCVLHGNRALISEIMVIVLPQGICLKHQGLKAISLPKSVNSQCQSCKKGFIEKCMFSQTNMRSTVHVHLTFQQDIKIGIQSNILKQFQLPALKQFSVLVQKKTTETNCGQQMRSVFPCLKKKDNWSQPLLSQCGRGLQCLHTVDRCFLLHSKQEHNKSMAQNKPTHPFSF